MRLEKLHLGNFKNYTDVLLHFEGNVHTFLGKNGSGKTNLLEAIHYLSFTRGGIHAHDPANIRHGEDHFSITGIIEKGAKKFEVGCTYSLERKKKMLENGKEYSRFSSHIGKYPLVLVAPHDAELVSGSGEPRRKFFDTLLSQIDKEYLQSLIVYQSQLRQRNSLLMMLAERNTMDTDLLISYEEQLVDSGSNLFRRRGAFLQDFIPKLKKNYDWLSGGSKEVAGISYESELAAGDFAEMLTSKRNQDLMLGRTTVGIHRDDFVFKLDGHDLKPFGSQGQQKTFLIALKMTEFESLKVFNSFKPFLLLDDIFDKLDDERIHRLVEMMQGQNFGQIFITDARPARSLEVLKEAGVLSQNFKVERGTIF